MIPGAYALGAEMKRFVEGEDRKQGVLLPEYLDDYVAENNPVRVIDVFVGELDLSSLGFDGIVPEATGRPGYHPSVLLKIYIYGYLNQVQSSRRLEREVSNRAELADHFSIPRCGHARPMLCSCRRRSGRRLAPRHGFRFKNKLYSLDSSLIDLSLAVFPWAYYALGKAAMKLHLGLDHDGMLPAFAVVTESRISDLAEARRLVLTCQSLKTWLPANWLPAALKGFEHHPEIFSRK